MTTWVWRPYFDMAPAEIDRNSPVTGVDALSDVPLNVAKGSAIYRTSAPLKSFAKLDCPPLGNQLTVSEAWKQIIAGFVAPDRIQFYPATLIGSMGQTLRFHWVLPFDRATCIDPSLSDIDLKINVADDIAILKCNSFVHHQGCLDGKHLVRDRRMLTHVVVSDDLKCALDRNGSAAVFYRPADVPTVGVRPLH